MSHTTALEVWGLHKCEPAEPVHATVPAGVRLRPARLVVVHRRVGLVIEPPQVLVRDGVPVTRLEQTLVDAWPLLPEAERYAPMIRAVNDRQTTAERLVEALECTPRLADRAACRGLLARLASGCRSALEIWGHDHVFTGSDLPPFQRQVRVQVDGRTYYLDVYAEAERVDFELDGAASHGSPAQREADLRRDALLATRRHPGRPVLPPPAAARDSSRAAGDPGDPRGSLAGGYLGAVGLVREQRPEDDGPALAGRRPRGGRVGLGSRRQRLLHAVAGHGHAASAELLAE